MAYDRLLGQRKAHDGLDQFASIAHAEFGRWILQNEELAEASYDEVYWTFQTLVQIAEEVRVFQLDRWDDSRPEGGWRGGEGLPIVDVFATDGDDDLDMDDDEFDVPSFLK